MRYACVADIHGNLEALEAVISRAGHVDAWLCLGDIAGYGPNPSECIELVRELRMLCIHGNHELGILDRIDIAGFNHLAREAAFWTRRQLSTDAVEFLEGLPEQRSIEDGLCLLVHGSLDNCQDYLASDADREKTLALLEQRMPACRLVLYGHTHHKHVYSGPDVSFKSLDQTTVPLRKESRYLLNPGSCGQPRDGDADAAFAVLDTDAQTWTQHLVPYDIDAVYEKILRNKLPVELAVRLKKGL